MHRTHRADAGNAKDPKRRTVGGLHAAPDAAAVADAGPRAVRPVCALAGVPATGRAPAARSSLREIGLVVAGLMLAGSCNPDSRTVTHRTIALPGHQHVPPAASPVDDACADAFSVALGDFFPTPARRHAAIPEREVVGRSVEGRAIECITFGDGPDCVLIMATIHGNEDAGTPLVEHMIGLLGDRPDLLAGRRIVLMPDVNPDGRVAQSRGNARGVDLNRNYPAENFQPGSRHGEAPLSEPESRVIESVLRRFQPSRIISIHQPLNSRDAMIDYDGPAESLAAAMAAHTDIPVQRIGSRPGSLGSYAGLTLGIPIITLELPPAAKAWPGHVLWEKYGDMMTASILNSETLGDSAVARAAGEE